jgi:hypothetical protein
MDIVDIIHPVVCQKFDFYGNSDFQNSHKLNPLRIPGKNFNLKYTSLSKIFWYKKLTYGSVQK